MQSRLRSVGCKIHPQLILTANPNINSFLKTWVDYCLDPDTGVPVEGTEHRIRWFCVEDNKARWADSPEECYKLYGEEKGMIYAHGMTEAQMNGYSKDERTRLFMPKSFRFIPTGVFDNPYLLPPKNNSYLASLMSQTYVNQLVFLHGSWTAREEGSMYFNREWTPIVDIPPAKAKRVRAWDFASEEKTKTNSPDWTAGVKMSRDEFGIYYIEDVIRIQATTDKVLKTVIETAHEDGVADCDVCIPLDPAAAGKTAMYFYRKTMAEHGVPTKTAPTTSGKGKLIRFLPFCSIAEAGAVRVIRADWNEAFFNELEAFSSDLKVQKSQKDDMLDACADSFSCLCRSVTLPTFVVPNLTQPSPIPTI